MSARNFGAVRKPSWEVEQDSHPSTASNDFSGFKFHDEDEVTASSIAKKRAAILTAAGRSSSTPSVGSKGRSSGAGVTPSIREAPPATTSSSLSSKAKQSPSDPPRKTTTATTTTTTSNGFNSKKGEGSARKAAKIAKAESEAPTRPLPISQRPQGLPPTPPKSNDGNSLRPNGVIRYGEGQPRRMPPPPGLETWEVVSVVGGKFHMYLLTVSGVIFAIGEGKDGQLGSGEKKRASSFQEVTNLRDTPCLFVAAGSHCGAAIVEDGDLYTWGRGKDYILGHGNSRTLLNPERVAALAGKKVREVSFGKRHGAAVTQAGLLYTWGRNKDGSLGHPGSNEQLLPMPVDLHHIELVLASRDVTIVSLGDRHLQLSARNNQADPDVHKQDEEKQAVMDKRNKELQKRIAALEADKLKLMKELDNGREIAESQSQTIVELRDQIEHSSKDVSTLEKKVKILEGKNSKLRKVASHVEAKEAEVGKLQEELGSLHDIIVGEGIAADAVMSEQDVLLMKEIDKVKKINYEVEELSEDLVGLLSAAPELESDSGQTKIDSGKVLTEMERHRKAVSVAGKNFESYLSNLYLQVHDSVHPLSGQDLAREDRFSPTESSVRRRAKDKKKARPSTAATASKSTAHGRNTSSHNQRRQHEEGRRPRSARGDRPGRGGRRRGGKATPRSRDGGEERAREEGPSENRPNNAGRSIANTMVEKWKGATSAIGKSLSNLEENVLYGYTQWEQTLSKKVGVDADDADSFAQSVDTQSLEHHESRSERAQGRVGRGGVAVDQVEHDGPSSSGESISSNEAAVTERSFVSEDADLDERIASLRQRISQRSRS